MTKVRMDDILKELWQIRNPHISFDSSLFDQLKESFLQQYKKETNKIKLPFTKKIFFELTTARNRNLINPQEQHELRQTVVAFFGLSVGSHAALTWMMQSRADAIKIIDFDDISSTNLNRLRLGYSSIGDFKVDHVKEQLIGMNPFSEIYDYKNVSPENLDGIITNGPRVDIIVDEIDNIEDKLRLRQIAKKAHLPIISAADVGDNIILDIERYDIDEKTQPFLGKLPNIEKTDFSKLTPNEKKRMIIQLLGFEGWSERLLDSIFAIGGSVPTWPQLGATATISGGVIATTLKKIILGEKIKSGRYYISLDDILVNDFNSKENRKRRKQKISKIKELVL